MPWAGAFKGQPRFSVVPMGLGTAYYYEGTATEGDRLAGMGLIVQVGGLPSPTLRAVPNEPRLLRFEVPPVGQPSGLVILAVAGQVLAVPRGTTIINPNGTVTKIPPRGP